MRTGFLTTLLDLLSMGAFFLSADLGAATFEVTEELAGPGLGGASVLLKSGESTREYMQRVRAMHLMGLPFLLVLGAGG